MSNNNKKNNFPIQAEENISKAGAAKKRVVMIAAAAVVAIAAPFIAKNTGKDITADIPTEPTQIVSEMQGDTSVPFTDIREDETEAGSTAAAVSESEEKTASDTTQKTKKPKTTVKKTTTQAPVPDRVKENGHYTSKDEVALYIHLYGHLPDNFITKKQAQTLGWNGGSLEPYSPGSSIGGDHFGNYEGKLPAGRKYTECDIGTAGRSSRGAKRIVFSDRGEIYYTGDHYETFTRLY